MKLMRNHVTPPSVTIRLTIKNGPVHDQRFSTTGRRFQVERVGITYQYCQVQGIWDVVSAYYIDVSGTVLKKDGSKSLNDHTRIPDYVQGKGMVFELTGGWEWLSDVIDQYRPTGEINLPG